MKKGLFLLLLLGGLILLPGLAAAGYMIPGDFYTVTITDWNGKTTDCWYVGREFNSLIWVAGITADTYCDEFFAILGGSGLGSDGKDYLGNATYTDNTDPVGDVSGITLHFLGPNLIRGEGLCVNNVSLFVFEGKKGGCSF